MESERDVFIRMANIFTSAEGHYRAQISAMFKLILLKVMETADENALPARMVEELDNYIRDNVAEEISNTEIGAIPVQPTKFGLEKLPLSALPLANSGA
jgi:hypothetical protein